MDYSILNSENAQLLQAIIDDEPSYTKETHSRNAEILKSIINDTEYTEPPQSEIEELLLELKEHIHEDVVVEPLSVTSNGTYSEAGKAYSPVTVEVAPPEDSYQLKSITTPTSLATFEASAMPMPTLKVSVEAKQEGSGVPSPENIRPISGWSEVNVTDTDDVDNPTVTQTTTITLPQTVYGGEVDVVNGGGKNNYAISTLNNMADWGYNSDYGVFYFYAYSKKAGRTNLLSDRYKVVDSPYQDMSNGEISGSNGTGINIKDDRYNNVNDFLTANGDSQLVYELATPTTLTTQPTPVKSLEGTNNLSVDSGDVIEGEYFIKL